MKKQKAVVVLNGESVAKIALGPDMAKTWLSRWDMIRLAAVFSPLDRGLNDEGIFGRKNR